MAEPKLGQPVEDTVPVVKPQVKIPGGALCGKPVPVDYDRPDGDVAALALIRFRRRETRSIRWS